MLLGKAGASLSSLRKNSLSLYLSWEIRVIRRLWIVSNQTEVLEYSEGLN